MRHVLTREEQARGGRTAVQRRAAEGARRWWAQFTPEERADIMAGRRAIRRARERREAGP
jgi:hypothetical protein